MLKLDYIPTGFEGGFHIDGLIYNGPHNSVIAINESIYPIWPAEISRRKFPNIPPEQFIEDNRRVYNYQEVMIDGKKGTFWYEEEGDDSIWYLVVGEMDVQVNNLQAPYGPPGTKWVVGGVTCRKEYKETLGPLLRKSLLSLRWR